MVRPRRKYAILFNYCFLLKTHGWLEGTEGETEVRVVAKVKKYWNVRKQTTRINRHTHKDSLLRRLGAEGRGAGGGGRLVWWLQRAFHVWKIQHFTRQSEVSRAVGHKTTSHPHVCNKSNLPRSVFWSIKSCFLNNVKEHDTPTNFSITFFMTGRTVDLCLDSFRKTIPYDEIEQLLLL